MNRFKKYLATAALLALPILAACGEGPIIPPATGSITGQVSIEGMGADGVSVNLSNGASTTTAGGGNYRFDGVQAGSYTVTISGFPADASFDATSASVTIPENGGSVTHNFQGTYIRTASVMGTASAAVKPEQWERDTGVDAGVSVAVLTVLSGVAAYSALTGNGRVNDCRTAQLQLTNARNRDAADMREAGRAHDGSATRSAVPRAALLIGAPATWTRLLQRPRRLEPPS